MPSRVGNGPIAPSKPPKPWRAERSRKGGSHLAFAVEHADRMRTVTVCPGGGAVHSATNVRNAAPALCHLACHSPQAEDRSHRLSRPRPPRACGHVPGCLRPAPLQSRQGYLPKAVRPFRLSLAAAGPAGRPPAVLRAAYGRAGLHAGYVRCPVWQRHSRPVRRRREPCPEWCREGWLQLPLLHQERRETAAPPPAGRRPAVAFQTYLRSTRVIRCPRTTPRPVLNGGAGERVR
jgi:hypothetical protein